jgi:hypothetical protein
MNPQAHSTEPGDRGRELLEKIRRSERPVPVRKLRIKGLPQPEFEAYVDNLTREGQIHRWESGKTSYVWHTAPADYARSAALLIASDVAAPANKLASSVAASCFRLFSRSNCETVLKTLVASGELRELPKPGASSAKTKVVFAARSPEAYLRTLAEYVSVLLDKAEEFGASRQEFISALQRSRGKGVAVREDPLQERVYRALERHQLSAGAHVAVGAVREDPELRDVSKSDFDRAVLRLADAQRIELAAHDDVYHLSEQDRKMLVFEEPNRYYVALATRRH